MPVGGSKPVAVIEASQELAGCDLVNMYSDWNRQVARAVCMAESHGDCNAHMYSDVTKDDSYGLMQINIYGKLAATRPSAQKLLDSKYNMAYAHSMWQGQGFKPWSTYLNNKYLKYL